MNRPNGTAQKKQKKEKKKHSKAFKKPFFSKNLQSNTSFKNLFKMPTLAKHDSKTTATTGVRG